MRRWSHVGVQDQRKERFLRRPSGSEVSGENWPVAGSNIPEEPESASPEGEAGGGEVLAGGPEELVSVGWAGLSVLVEVSGGRELVVSGGVSSPESSPEPSPESSPESSSGGVTSEGGVSVELFKVVQLNADVRLEKSVPFMPAIRLGRALGATKHVVVVLVPALSVIFEVGEGSVRFELLAPETPVEFESNARHAGGGVGMSLKDGGQRLAHSKLEWHCNVRGTTLCRTDRTSRRNSREREQRNNTVRKHHEEQKKQ